MCSEEPHKCFGHGFVRVADHPGIQGRPVGYKPCVCVSPVRYKLRCRKTGEIRYFCKVHYRLALEGFISATGEHMDPRDKRNCRVYGIRPFFENTWEKLPEGEQHV